MKYLAILLIKASSVLRTMGLKLSSNREWTALLKRWKKLDKKKEYRTNYPDINPNSIVFDLGGYQGQWASDIYSRYLCNLYVFEPHPEFVVKIKKRFLKNKNIKVYDFGLGDKNESLMLTTEGDASSVYNKGKDAVEINLVDAEKFLEKEMFDFIDLMKINIEGGEYQLLEHLINTGRIKKIKNIQVQFHHFVPNAKQLMNDLHKRLAKTHEPTYLYQFFWENWKLKE